MTYYPPSDPAWPMVSTFGRWSSVPASVIENPPSSSAIESANTVFYFPLSLPTRCVARRLWWANGSTVSASYNIDVGVYADAGYKPGAKLVSTGSTAQGTASQVQFVDVTDTYLAPGLYWLAITCSSTSATFFDSSGASPYNALFRFEQSSTFPLPATATPAEAAYLKVQLFGFATTASP